MKSIKGGTSKPGNGQVTHSNKKPDEFSQHIGRRIKYFRSEKDISLSELSRRSGIAKGTLSKLESGGGNPTILTLGALAGILDLTPGDFMDQQKDVEPLLSGRHDVLGPDIRMLFIHRIVSSFIWDIYEATLPVVAGPIHSAKHGGIEHLFMIAGAAEVGPKQAPAILRPGEKLSFPGNQPHIYFPLEHPCKMLLLMQHPRKGGERITP